MEKRTLNSLQQRIDIVRETLTNEPSTFVDVIEMGEPLVGVYYDFWKALKRLEAEIEIRKEEQS